MMEKRNRTMAKGAAGDSGALDDIVDFASKRMARAKQTEAKPRPRLLSVRVREDAPVPADHV